MGRRTMKNRHPWLPAMFRVWVAIAAQTLWALAAAQSPVALSLALNSPTQPAATPTIATVTVSDAAGPVRFGMVDILDGTQRVQTLQLASTSVSGFTPGTAILRHIFAPGTHQLTAAFHATTADAAATSATVALTVTAGTYSSTGALHYAQTIDFSVNNDYNVLADVVVADFNNDGIPDIATVQGYPNALTVSLADKPGHFLPPTNLPITSNSYDTFLRVLAADLDADGLVDLIVTGGGDDYTLFFRNNPAAPGTFLAPTQLIPDHGTPVAIADFNHDGLPDVAYIQGNALYTNPSNITVALNRQSAPGTFLFNVTAGSFSGYGVVGLIAADMNGDGFPDLVIRCMPLNSSAYEFIVLLSDPAHPGQFLAPTAYSPSASIYSIVAQDLNHDGLPDIIVAGDAPNFLVYLGDPAHPGQLLAPQTVTTPLITQPGILVTAAGDLNGDGIPDAVIDAGNVFFIFPGKGDGTFLAPTTLLEGLTAPAWESSATILNDLDGDGLNDLVTTEYDQDTAQIFLHNTQVIAPTLQTATDLTVSPSTGNIASGIPITFTVTETASSGQPTGSVDLFETVGFPPYQVIATLPLVGNTATFTTSSLAAGVHEPVAVFHGNSIYAPSQSAGAVLNILQNQSANITLTAAPNPATAGQAVTLTATVTGRAQPPTGSVTFLDSGQNIGTATLVNGVASFTTSTLAVGSHSIQVSYSGNYQSQTSNSITVTIQGAASTTQLAVSPNPANYGSPVAIAFTVTGPAVATGTIRLLDGPAAIATLPLDATGKASTTLNTLSPGVHPLSGVYSGDTTHTAATSNTVSLSVVNGPTTATLTAAPRAPFAFQPIQLQAAVTSTAAVSPTLPTGKLTVSNGSQTLAAGTLGASGTLTASVPLPAGGYSLLASYSGDTYFAATSSAVSQLTVVPDTTSTTLQAAPSPALQQQTVTFSVVIVAGHSTTAPGGTVTLSDGSTIIASGPVTAGHVLRPAERPLPRSPHHRRRLLRQRELPDLILFAGQPRHLRHGLHALHQRLAAHHPDRTPRAPHSHHPIPRRSAGYPRYRLLRAPCRRHLHL
jgi:hypothetical protein